VSLDYLKPSEADIRRLAEQETDPALAASFEPVCRGPLVAFLILAAIGIAAIPHFVLRTLRLAFGGASRPAQGL
jgi:hypothetical protein